MAENTKISWAHSTHNFWVGCTKISPACDNCYACDWAKRTGQSELWAGDLRRTTAQNWHKPIRWNAKAAETGETHRVFSSSLSDFFDNKAPNEWREDAWALIRATPYLTWMILTKRPQNIAKMLPPNWGEGYPNVWIGCTVENQAEADRRIPHLMSVPARARFLSAEPLLGPIKLADSVAVWAKEELKRRILGNLPGRTGNIHWVIVGGESGPNARPMHPGWVRDLRDQCVEAAIAFHFKQWGLWKPYTPRAGGDLSVDVRKGLVRIVHPGGETDVEVSEKTGGRSTLPGSRYMKKWPGEQHGPPLLEGRIWQDFPNV